ncbi:MAG TPA: NAD(P)-dependent oxidoreductase [Gaiellaceae bacterium]|nr:NAD(P)-dependent oxidoreductase [Gaiellaceae bacterium]
MTSRRVLITGAAGLIGGILRRGLADEFELSGVDARSRLFRGRAANMRKLRSVLGDFANQGAVIDLAADSDPTAGWSSIYGNNLLATYNAFEASRRADVRRVIFASSNHVTGLYEWDRPYDAIVAGRYEGLDQTNIPLLTSDAPIRPDGLYAVGKAFGEALGRFYAEEYGLSVICLRIGTVNAADRPRIPRHFATLLTHKDLVRLVRCAIQAPDDLAYGIFYGVSNNAWRFWGLDDARESLGYVPEDDAELWR